ncbi:MAG: phosphoribosylformimino-5-aminoimidazole carboxamide ribotide isomerase [Lachnospiraceae bacterium]|nr:phosphoribosylformimino-5-aminoimidazole carboxamide ribotide isomerase [Lachnospiraceae bacterium]
MEYRPCIDIHNGKVKQIIGASLSDEGDRADENYVSERGADFFAGFYRDEGLYGGHVIILNSKDSSYYEKTKEQALMALRTFPGGMQVGGGINPDNAMEFLDAGASHVIVTSYAFVEGQLSYDRIRNMANLVGPDRLVIDLSARKRLRHHYVVTDRWQTFTDERVTVELFEKLSPYCAEFLVHAVDMEGKSTGIDEEVLEILASYSGKPITYAGGISSYEDIDRIRQMGEGRINVTIGSAMDLFGGELNYETVISMCNHSLDTE